MMPPSEVGQWDGPYQWPVSAIHSFLLPTGKVLHFDFPGFDEWPGAWLWDAATWEFTPVPVDRPLFCSGHSFLADGRLLVTGGNGPAPPDEFRGIRDTHIFDPFDETWTRVEDMADGRWYPTNVTLPDGRVLVFSGFDELTGKINTDVEVYEPGSTTGWQIVSQVELPLYPTMHVLSSGDVFYSGPSQITGTYKIGTWSWYGIVWSNYGGRDGGMSVLLPPERDRVMIIGGQSEGVVTETAEIIDLDEPLPAWRYTQPMNFPRMHANGVLLPDGKLLVIGGHSEMHEHDHEDDVVAAPPSAVYQAEMFDPETETWSGMAAMQRPRVYHSTAILLPDGRVLAGGSDGEFTTELYSPPYLFRGPRPVIEAAPGRLPYSEPFVVETPDAPGIDSVVLIRLSSVTHSVNMAQRYVPLEFSRPPQAPASLVVNAPGNPNLAPPGYYMLFLIDVSGVPSTAMMVQLGSGPVTSSPSPRPLPKAFALSQNYPNPFNSSTRLDYQIPEIVTFGSYVNLNIYNISGQLIRTLVDEKKAPGAYSVNWNGRDNKGRAVSSGIYYYTIVTDGYKQTKKMLLLQ
ncbi:MAG: galactose oxidase-like domain-containing protein [bacterium]